MKLHPTLTLAPVVLAVLVGLNSWADAPIQATFFSPVPGIPPVDINGNPATSPDTAMGNAMCLPGAVVPILTPTGQPVTMAQWLGVTGTATAKCVQGGTHVTLHLSGLIPNGVYTVWLFAGDAVGSLGKNDGSENVLKVSTSGQADLSVFQPAGPLSVTGSVTDCLNSGPFTLLVAYHLDGRTYGPTPSGGNDCRIGIGFGFNFNTP
jgi:hypothetical protein